MNSEETQEISREDPPRGRIRRDPFSSGRRPDSERRVSPEYFSGESLRSEIPLESGGGEEAS